VQRLLYVAEADRGAADINGGICEGGIENEGVIEDEDVIEGALIDTTLENRDPSAEL